MTTYIRHIAKSQIMVRYYRGVLACVFVETKDKVLFDGVKHELELFESELDITKWIKVEL